MGRAREHLDESRPCSNQSLDLVNPLEREMRAESEINNRPILEIVDFLLQCLRVVNRARVAVLNDGGHACYRGCSTPGGEILSRRVSRIHEVDMSIHHPGKNKEARRIDRLLR